MPLEAVAGIPREAVLRGTDSWKRDLVLSLGSAVSAITIIVIVYRKRKDAEKARRRSRCDQNETLASNLGSTR
jgi:hypothetical protein